MASQTWVHIQRYLFNIAFIAIILGVMMGENDVLISKRVKKDQKDTSMMVKQGEHGNLH
jgi:hypothetical protein